MANLTKHDDFSACDETIDYLRRQIDPHDRLNPKYAKVQAAIDALIQAKVDIVARQALTAIRLTETQHSSESEE